MKKNLILSTLLMTSLITGAAFAHEYMSADQIVMKLKDELKLSDEQANAVAPIVQDCKSKMDQIEKDKEEKLSKILNPDQMNKFREMKAKHDK